MKSPNMILTIALLAVLALSACDVTTITPGASFSSEAELKTYLESHTDDYGYLGGFGLRGDVMMAESAMDASPSAAGVDFTKTNNQEANVDEADLIKTNGEHIFTIDGNGVTIIRTLPADETEIVERIELEWTPSALFLEEDTLMVIGQAWEREVMTIIVAYDISDPTEPEELFDNRIEGSYVTGRYTDRAYIVSQSSPDITRPIPMPFIIENGVRGSVAIDRIIMPVPVDSPRFLTITAIGTSGELESSSIITEGWPTVYASENAIHLAMRRTINEWELRQGIMRETIEPMLSSDERDLIERIEATDNDVLSAYEKESKIQQVLAQHLYGLDREEQADIEDEIETKTKRELEQHDSFEYTDLIAVPYRSLEASDPVEVLGTVNNQFSLSERDGVLRVATTTNPRWSLGEGVDDMENHVWTVRDGEVLDHEDGLAMGERIFSARYLDDRLYLVTFRQVDPFFTIDLSDPENIEVLGELKIPGFSRYLHSYSEDVIIGLGRDATETGRQQGLKISLFDVSDPERPRELTNWVSDERYVSSAAEWEHKAFLLDRENDLLVIPISGTYNWDVRTDDRIAPYEPRRTNGGALVFGITQDDIELRGFIEHDSYNGVERSIVIEDALYTKSSEELLVNGLGDLEEIAQVELEGSGPIWG